VYPDDWSLSMRLLPLVAIFAVLATVAAAASAQSAPPNAAAPQPVTHVTLPPVPQPLLPDAFSGWIAPAAPEKIASAAQADPAAEPALQEYGFTDGVKATYKRESETLTVRALRFQDASGAFGAYSFYRQNGWPKEEIGAGATSDHNRVLFWQGNIVVDANFSQIGPMSGAEMRDLAGQLPRIEGPKALAPPILSDLPTNLLDGRTTHYALGPVGYAGAGGVLPPALVGFDLGAETIAANYSLRSGPATLTVIDYPTPQIAAVQEAKIRDYIKAGSRAQPPWPKPLTDSDLASLEVRRSGPLVAIVSGDAIPDESHRLLQMVHYESQLTSIPQPTESEIAKTGRFLIAITKLILVGVFAALLLGFLLGGFRAAYRLWRGKPVSSVYETEFISLNLRDWPEENTKDLQSPHLHR
jgi:hypothetical protein